MITCRWCIQILLPTLISDISTAMSLHPIWDLRQQNMFLFSQSCLSFSQFRPENPPSSAVVSRGAYLTGWGADWVISGLPHKPLRWDQVSLLPPGGQGTHDMGLHSFFISESNVYSRGTESSCRPPVQNGPPPRQVEVAPSNCCSVMDTQRHESSCLLCQKFPCREWFSLREQSAPLGYNAMSRQCPLGQSVLRLPKPDTRYPENACWETEFSCVGVEYGTAGVRMWRGRILGNQVCGNCSSARSGLWIHEIMEQMELSVSIVI